MYPNDVRVSSSLLFQNTTRDSMTYLTATNKMSGLQTNAARYTTASEDIMMGSLLPTTPAKQGEHLHLLNSEQKDNATKADHTVLASTYNPSLQGLTRSTTNPIWIWWKESVLLLLATSILVAISSILAIYTGKPLPKWTLGLNLNTVVALMATLLRSSLVMVVEEGWSSLTIHHLCSTKSQFSARQNGRGNTEFIQLLTWHLLMKPVVDHSALCFCGSGFLHLVEDKC